MKEKQKRPRQTQNPITLGDVFGEAIAKDRAIKKRARELEDMGFKPIKTDPNLDAEYQRLRKESDRLGLP